MDSTTLISLEPHKHFVVIRIESYCDRFTYSHTYSWTQINPQLQLFNSIISCYYNSMHKYLDKGKVSHHIKFLLVLFI